MLGAMTYTFGDNDTAARRLGLLADVYRPSSEDFLRRWAGAPRLAVDLGCGPGHTTRLVHNVTGAAETFGLDASEAYVAVAPGEGSDGLKFVRHDVTQRPLPAPPADLLYCRFLLTHLTDPVSALRVWRAAAADGGRLLVEELEWLRSPSPVLSRYYELVEATQARHGQKMFIGAELPAAAREAGWQVTLSEATPLRPDAAQMARLHMMNLATLRGDSFLAANFSAAELDQIAEGLAAVARGDEVATVDYGMRRIVAVAE